MPELPDIVVYIEALERRLVGETIEGFRVASPSVLRTYDPPYSEIEGKQIRGFSRLGKRIIWELEDDLYVVVHLMIAGRLRWVARPRVPIPKKVGMAAWEFSESTLILTEQGTKKRAGVWVIRGAEALSTQDRGGLEALGSDSGRFAEALTRENRTLKRVLTDPRVFSGIGNAYSDEILWEARLSPVSRVQTLTHEDIVRLHQAAEQCLTRWIELLRNQVGDGWPEKITAFRPEMAVHGKYAQPCPRCQAPVQRIVYAENEVNYCPRCQTGGKILADRSLSRILKGDWPRTLEELEEGSR